MSGPDTVDNGGRAASVARHVVFDWAPALAWMALIYLSSSQPALPGPPGTPQDFVIKKSAHLATYAVLAILSWRALRTHKQSWFLALLITVIYAVSDEWHQSFVPPREAAVRDVLIDAVGGSLGLLALQIWRGHFSAAGRTQG